MYSDTKTVIAVVLYQMPPHECPTLQSLITALPVFNGYTLYIYDNSPESQQHQLKNFCTDGKINICYFHNPLNPGVAAAYNHVGAFAVKTGSLHLVLLDQDTHITEQYMAELVLLLKKQEVPDLWVPMVKCNGLIISPIIFRLGRFWRLKADIKGKTKTAGYTVINSGMAITVRAFQEINGYDEDFPLDMSDHLFFWRYKKRYASFYVMGTTLQHNLSVITNTDKQQALKRYALQKQASWKFLAKTGNSLHFFWCLVRGVRLSIRYKTLKFLTS